MPGPVDLYITHDDEEKARQHEAPDHRARNVTQWVPRLTAERGGAFKAHQAEDAGDDGQAHPMESHALELDLAGVDVDAVGEKHDRGEDKNASDREGFEYQGED